MFDDAFTSIARDGAGTIEVMLRLQKALIALTRMDNAALAEAARRHAGLALARAQHALQLDEDVARVRELTHSIDANGAHKSS